jgi:putative ABC transport system permease protein
MVGYYVGMAVRSARRSVALTALMVVAVGVGIGASMTVLTALRAMSADPIPAKSQQLFSVRIDNWGPDAQNNASAGDLISYPDATALVRAHHGARQTAMYATQFSVLPATGDAIPISATARAVSADFFPMFDVPVAAGAPWSRIDDDNHANVVVLGARLASRLFPGGDAVGRTITLGEQTYRVTGVLAPWRFQPRVYDLTTGIYQETEDVFLPMTTAADRKLATYGEIYCNRPPASSDWEALGRSECRWVQFWVELSSAAQRRSYVEFLNNYAQEQHRIGRFRWRANVSLLDVEQTLKAEKIVPGQMRIATVAAFGFLIVCLVNATGLMLANLNTRLAEFSVRRAVGARRGQIFTQCLAEAAAVGVGGSALGLGLVLLGLAFERAILREDYARLVSLDADAVATTVLLALLTVVVAALFPAWQVSRLAPAWKLKVE